MPGMNISNIQISGAASIGAQPPPPTTTPAPTAPTPIAPASPPIMALDPANYSAGIVTDSSGNGNDLAVNGGSYNAGTAGGAVSWTGGQYGTVASSSTLSALTNAGFSIATWVNFQSLSGNNPIIECTTNNSWGWRLDGLNLLNLVKYNVIDEQVSTTALDTNTWYYLIAAMGPTGVTYYVNGLAVGTYFNTSSMNTPTNSSLTFAHSDYTSANSSLTIGVNSIYNIELTANNAVYLFNQDAVRYGYTPL